jgi:hypothetical protein
MTTETSYPLFIPPGELGLDDKNSWTSAQSRAYLDWLTSIAEQRVSFFRAWLNCANLPLVENNLDIVDARFQDALFDSIFFESKTTPTRLSNAGYAIAADWGLNLALVILKTADSGTVWETLRSPKSDASYNLPVLKRNGRLPMEPVGLGIAQATSIIRGISLRHSARAIYKFWLGRE